MSASHANDGDDGTALGAPALLLGTSEPLAAVRQHLKRIARSDATVLIRGESGTGKELAAHLIHRSSGRRGSLVAVNCGALSPQLVHSELFGHTRGAFTGAVAERRGAFARAHRGTLFLDEIGELAPSSQALLLRVLETGALTPVGGESEITFDTRVVCATHRNLEAMVTEGSFRQDLFHRLSVLPVRMPALRERPEDVDTLIAHFCMQLEGRLGYRVEVNASARRAARRHSWPGNVRELRNRLEAAALLSAGEVIDASFIPPEIGSTPAGELRLPWSRFHTMRKQIVRLAIEREGSLRKASKVLGVPRSTLSNWIKAS